MCAYILKYILNVDNFNFNFLGFKMMIREMKLVQQRKKEKRALKRTNVRHEEQSR
jgi:ABC-type iron transport system FetAB permease component